MTDSLDPKQVSTPIRSATSVAIAAETIGQGCGLGNYLACLQSALEAQCSDGRRIQVLTGTEGVLSEGPLRVDARDPIGEGILKRGLRRLLGPIHRRLDRLAARPPAEVWAATWQALDEQTVCLLPHVACDDHGALDWYYATLARRPLVWVVHDLHPLHFPEQWHSEFVATFERRCRSLAMRARAIICHNEYTKADICARLDAPSEKIAVVHLPSILPACDMASLPPAAEVLPSHGIGQPYALWASSSTFGHKNHDRLLRAWKMLIERGHDIQLVCTGGKEPRWQAIADLIEKLGLGHRVVFTGNVSREVLWVVLLNAKLAVCPTLFEGGGSGPATEAVMSRIPVACARIPQVVEQFAARTDLCAWFDPMDEVSIAGSVSELLSNYDAAIARAAHAAAVYPQLRSWERVAEVYWRTLDRAAASAPGRARGS